VANALHRRNGRHPKRRLPREFFVTVVTKVTAADIKGIFKESNANGRNWEHSGDHIRHQERNPNGAA
jgi:hypothetical protein